MTRTVVTGTDRASACPDRTAGRHKLATQVVTRQVRPQAARSGRGDALGHVAPVSSVQVALSTASVFPERVPDAFETAARLGYDGVEVMVSADPVSQDLDVLRRLSDSHAGPCPPLRAPVCAF